MTHTPEVRFVVGCDWGWETLAQAEATRKYNGGRIYRITFEEVTPQPVPTVTVGGKTWTQGELGWYHTYATANSGGQNIAGSDLAYCLDALWLAQGGEG